MLGLFSKQSRTYLPMSYLPQNVPCGERHFSQGPRFPIHGPRTFIESSVAHNICTLHHHPVFKSTEQKTPAEENFEEEVQPLFSPSCGLIERDQIISSMMNIIKKGAPTEKKLVAELLIRLCRDEQLFIFPTTRDYLLVALHELNNAFAFRGIDLSGLDESYLVGLHWREETRYISLDREFSVFYEYSEYLNSKEPNVIQHPIYDDSTSFPHENELNRDSRLKGASRSTQNNAMALSESFSGWRAEDFAMLEKLRTTIKK